jgi:hypothetical protein
LPPLSVLKDFYEVEEDSSSELLLLEEDELLEDELDEEELQTLFDLDLCFPFFFFEWSSL